MTWIEFYLSWKSYKSQLDSSQSIETVELNKLCCMRYIVLMRKKMIVKCLSEFWQLHLPDLMPWVMILEIIFICPPNDMNTIFFSWSDYIWFPLLWKTIGCVRKVSNRNIGACLHEVGSQGTWNMWLILLVLIPIGWAAPGETTQKCHFWLISTSSLSVISWWHSHIVYSNSHPSC